MDVPRVQSIVDRHVFFREMMARGILLHPRHLWFLCRAHGEHDVSRTLDAADEAMAITSQMWGE